MDEREPPRRRLARFRSQAVSGSRPLTADTSRMPFPDMRPIENPHRVEVSRAGEVARPAQVKWHRREPDSAPGGRALVGSSSATEV